MTSKVVVLGSNFGGLTTALAVKHDLGVEVDVTVISPSDRFLFTPSLIWVPFGKRDEDDITFLVQPTLIEHGVGFVHAAATEIDPVARTVTVATGETYDYDYLVIATGFRNDFSAVPGLGPGGHASTITTYADAAESATAWKEFLKDPGNIVIGAAPGAGCFGAAYEFLFNTAHQLKLAGLRDRVRLTYVTAEPELGHFGIGGLPHGEKLLSIFTRRTGIDTITGVAIDSVDEHRMHLTNGETLPFKWAMVIPAFRGQQVVETAPGLADERGFVRVRDTYQSDKYDDVYGVGAAVAVDVPWTTAVPVGVPKTGFPTEKQAHVAARNIAAQIRGEQPTAEKAFGDIPAVCVMDAGNNGVLILADRMLPPRKHGVLIPGPQAHALKLAFEKYFLWKARNGYVNLP
jgi:sulfide:quinone oxidoreductase